MEEDLDRIAAGEVRLGRVPGRLLTGQTRATPAWCKSIEQEIERIDFPRIHVGTDRKTGAPIHLRIGTTCVYDRRRRTIADRRATLPVDLLIDELTAGEGPRTARHAANGPTSPSARTPRPARTSTPRWVPSDRTCSWASPRATRSPSASAWARAPTSPTITNEYALKLLSLPREIGTDPESGKPVRAGLGMYGPYVECEPGLRQRAFGGRALHHHAWRRRWSASATRTGGRCCASWARTRRRACPEHPQGALRALRDRRHAQRHHRQGPGSRRGDHGAGGHAAGRGGAAAEEARAGLAAQGRQEGREEAEEPQRRPRRRRRSTKKAPAKKAHHEEDRRRSPPPGRR